MAIRNRPSTGVGASRGQVQRKLVRVGDKPKAIKTVKAARAAAAAVTLKSNRKSMPVVTPKQNETPGFLKKASRARTGGIFGTQHG